MNDRQLATLGGGCFWCTEAIFKELRGVEKVVSGYSGGTVPGKPTYREVSSGFTGHAEVVQITFCTTQLSYETLLLVFMTTHNPTTLNRQGNDVGTHYRSVIFTHNNTQKKTAQRIIKQVQKIYKQPIVTEITAITNFYEAESSHQNYYKNNISQAYCTAVISPKLIKLREKYRQHLKSNKL